MITAGLDYLFLHFAFCIWDLDVNTTLDLAEHLPNVKGESKCMCNLAHCCRCWIVDMRRCDTVGGILMATLRTCMHALTDIISLVDRQIDRQTQLATTTKRFNDKDFTRSPFVTTEFKLADILHGSPSPETHTTEQTLWQSTMIIQNPINSSYGTYILCTCHNRTYFQPAHWQISFKY
ncbi:hypothetical protein MFRU_023g01090 [Monilinia fructicola]|nr:hypothetical protein MFRU_023g01090 [Monilinia fructicola]